MANTHVPKQVLEGQTFRRRVGIEDCIAALSIYNRVEYLSVKPQGEVFTAVCSWDEFHDMFEPSPFDIHKVHEVLSRRAQRQGATPRAAELLESLNPARMELASSEPQGDSNMATKKPAATPKKAAEKPKAAAAKPAAKPKAAAPVEKSGAGRKPAFNPTMKIKVLVDKNPKRAKAAERFNLYKNGMTVQDYLDAGGLIADVRWDVKQEFISVA